MEGSSPLAPSATKRALLAAEALAPRSAFAASGAGLATMIIGGRPLLGQRDWRRLAPFAWAWPSTSSPCPRPRRGARGSRLAASLERTYPDCTLQGFFFRIAGFGAGDLGPVMAPSAKPIEEAQARLWGPDHIQGSEALGLHAALQEKGEGSWAGARLASLRESIALRQAIGAGPSEPKAPRPQGARAPNLTSGAGPPVGHPAAAQLRIRP